jgi:hypothetical protein
MLENNLMEINLISQNASFEDNFNYYPIEISENQDLKPVPLQTENYMSFMDLKDSDYYNDDGLLGVKGIKFCSYYAGSNQNNENIWDYLVVLKNDIEPVDSTVKISVLGLEGDNSFYEQLNEFNKKEANPEKFNLSNLANFFDSKGYNVIVAK